MLAFHGDPAIKERYLIRLKEHAALDEIIKGKYWENGKGCAVGCTIHSANHSNYESELGIPQTLAYLEDRIFENLPNEFAMTWPMRFLESINVGTNLELVWPKFVYWLLIDSQYGVVRFNKHQSIIDIAELFQRWFRGKKPSPEEWHAAADAAADAAAAAAAYAAAAYAAAAAAADAAADAADAYTAAAADAADAAAYATDAASRSMHFIVMSEKLLELLNGEK